MKRYLISLLMICVLLYTAVLSSHLENIVLSKDPAEEKEKQVQKVNNEPPDLKYLEDLGMEPYVSEIPVIMIDTDDQQIIKEEMRPCTVSIYDDPSGMNDIMGSPTDQVKAGVKLRGASSYSLFDKFQYRIKILKDKGNSKRNYDLFGLGKESEWVFNGPFLDRSLMRNYIMYKISAQSMEWAPSCAFFELYVDGLYQGLYVAIEPVTVGADRLRLSKFGLVSGSTPYIVVRDRRGTEPAAIHCWGEAHGWTSNELSVRYPSPKKLSDQQKAWIERDVSQFEEALFSTAFDDPKLGYAQYIDMDSFARYFILNEFSLNYDAGNLSTYIYKELNGPMKLCVWDFNNAFDNYIYWSLDHEKWMLVDNNWFNRLVQDRNFVDCVVENYREMRQSSLSDENIDSLINGAISTMGNAAARNYTRWGYTLERSLLVGSNRDPRSFEQAVNMLRDSIQRRSQFMDTQIESLYEFCVN